MVTYMLRGCHYMSAINETKHVCVILRLSCLVSSVRFQIISLHCTTFQIMLHMDLLSAGEVNNLGAWCDVILYLSQCLIS